MWCIISVVLFVSVKSLNNVEDTIVIGVIIFVDISQTFYKHELTIRTVFLIHF